MRVAREAASFLPAIPEDTDGVPPGPVPAECPGTLDDLLAGDGSASNP